MSARLLLHSLADFFCSDILHPSGPVPSIDIFNFRVRNIRVR